MRKGGHAEESKRSTRVQHGCFISSARRHFASLSRSFIAALEIRGSSLLLLLLLFVDAIIEKQAIRFNGLLV